MAKNRGYDAIVCVMSARSLQPTMIIVGLGADLGPNGDWIILSVAQEVKGKMIVCEMEHRNTGRVVTSRTAPDEPIGRKIYVSTVI